MKKILIFSFFLVSTFSNYLLSAVELTDTQKQLLESLPPDQRQGVMSKMMQADQLNKELEEQFEEFSTITERPERKLLSLDEQEIYEERSKNWIYGYEIFQTSPTTFAPATDIPVSEDYVLGPGDQLNIQIYGNKNIEASSFISRNGDIAIPQIGPVSLVGLTLSQAIELISKKVSNELIGSEAYVSLGTLRTITVYVLGEAYQPGAYKVSSLSTLTNLLFVSGGVNEVGSVRNIQVKRGGKTIKTFDLYKLLLEGDTTNDIRLQQGDTIFIPLIESKARVYGSFRRPHLFEILDSDRLKDLVFYAGGVTRSAEIDGRLELTRLSKNSISVMELQIGDNSWENEKIENGDTLSAQSLSSLNTGVVELRGEFKFPGFYKILKNERLSSVINRAGGYTSDAYTYGANFTRLSVADQQKLSFERNADYLEQSVADALTSGNVQDVSLDSFTPISNLISNMRQLKPSGRQVIVADMVKIKADPTLDFYLQGGDVLTIPKRPNEVTVVGEVLNPSSLTFRPDDSITNYIESAGGFKASADINGVFIILPNGESREFAKTQLFRGQRRTTTLPGTTIVVPRDPQPFSWLFLARTITPILADSATAIATVEALLDD